MPSRRAAIESQTPAVETFLLGQVPWPRCLELQRRLLRRTADRDDGQVCVLMCEHPEVITIGRGGRPSQIAGDSGRLRSGQIETHWANRGGGCLLHCPGQLAIYTILPLRWHGFTVGGYLRRFHTALEETVTELGVQVQPRPQRTGVWGRTGKIAALGVAVRDWVTWHGAFLNVSPSMGLFRLVQSDPLDPAPMSSLAAERCGVIRMPTVRAILVRRLTEAFGCDRYHLYTGHPWL